MIHIALLIAAFVVFAIESVAPTPRVNLMSVGLALLTLSVIFIR